MLNLPESQTTMAQLGSIFQLAFVPRDFDAAIRFWTETVGAGPFFCFRHLPIDCGIFRGGKPTPLDLSVSLGYWRDMQIELFELHDDNPSTYREFRDSGRGGVHHVAIHPESKFAAAQLIESKGGVLEQELRMGTTRALYYRLPGDAPILELAEIPPPWQRAFDQMKEAAVNWSGQDPLREFPSVEGWLQ